MTCAHGAFEVRGRMAHCLNCGFAWQRTADDSSAEIVAAVRDVFRGEWRDDPEASLRAIALKVGYYLASPADLPPHVSGSELPDPSPVSLSVREGLMGCGHPLSAVVSGGEGTNYCGRCEDEARSVQEGQGET